MVSSIESAITSMIEELESFSNAFDAAWEGLSADNLKSSADAPQAIVAELQSLKGTVGTLKTVLNEIDEAKALSVEYNKYLSLSYDSNATEEEKELNAWQARTTKSKLEEKEKQICSRIPDGI